MTFDRQVRIDFTIWSYAHMVTDLDALVGRPECCRPLHMHISAIFDPWISDPKQQEIPERVQYAPQGGHHSLHARCLPFGQLI